jgi:murein L,D-transpeptidase YafK
VIVDKFSKKCYIYLAGTKKYEFDAELGRNWVGGKHRMGDKATPEGLYRIIKKYHGKATLYHKALAIDYPNSDDMEKFKIDLAKGNIPAYSRIGGGIEIHGGGGRGVDWTEGCIALTDSEIDIVFSLLKVGTPVIIVGSLKNIDEVLTN